MSSIPVDQVAFLFLCLQHVSGPGKVDFDAVARAYENIHHKELTSNAARKRFCRLAEKVKSMEAADGMKALTTSPKKRKELTQADSQLKAKKVKIEIKDEKDD